MLQVSKGEFTWEAGSTEASLSGVSFEAMPGSLTMIVGTVGSGKSSLLSALIGQMERISGTVAVGGQVAYVAQTAWIINDSVQVGSAFAGGQAGGDSGCSLFPAQLASFLVHAHHPYAGTSAGFGVTVNC